ncbi:MAG: hypothetical protein J5626_07120 [Lachnospiraceae bacterium]|nr:hypothetical protein [Lachnospiraceae bacterium]
MRKSRNHIALLMIAAAIVLGACGGKEESITEPAVKETVSLEPEVTSEEPVSLEKEAVAEPAAQEAEEEKYLPPYDAVTLDGIKENFFTSTDYCYIESEKYVLLLDKDIKLPGDFVINLDAVFDELEALLGLSYLQEGVSHSIVPEMSGYYGSDPWGKFDVGGRLPVFIMADRKDEGWVSCADNKSVIIVSNELFSDELWESVPSYRDNAWRRSEYTEYGTIAHELTHAITMQYVNMTDIVAEGIAEYMRRIVVDRLSDNYESMAEEKEKRYLYDNSIPEKVNAGNAESIFLSDYNYIEYAERGAEYTFGRYLWQFLYEQYGEDSYRKYNDTVMALKPNYNSYYYSLESIQPYADAMKEAFGEDIFTKFGDWCVANRVLQSLEGVW